MSPTLKQRADYTFKYNCSYGRHGWLRLTPAYSVKLVEKLLMSAEQNLIILDPFSGTATTALVAAENAYKAFTFDINPFLVWLGNIKCKNYSEEQIIKIRHSVNNAIVEFQGCIGEKHWIPNIFNIERWWSIQTLKIISALRYTLVKQFGEPENSADNGIVWIAFCRLVIETSSAAFNHVSMSFSETVNSFEVEQIEQLFINILDLILKSTSKPIKGSAKVIRADSRCVINLNGVKVDRVITSPPYPNRISYIRELRPYMYWTKFLNEAKEAGEIDWMAIGGTWGIATSRLKSWQIDEVNLLPESVYNAVENIRKSEGKNAHILSIYVLKYFYDMHLHLSSLRYLLKDGAKIDYIVGNSTFFGNRVDTASLLAESMKMLGYKKISFEIIRKRNCKKELYEYCVSATWEEA
ncbi:TRM11 family methyltransferase [Limnoraphis robusta]|uniref:DNA methyltransferase n=1 Tax=Limnoraphis robusta TaxID=1118279 RepID=UPI002B21D642|nr:DNA methyltransferase [Limnoraphis robusta]MEA5500747.1 DNA methyltransferase [Limnoraphis robusta BA-68 BA1]